MNLPYTLTSHSSEETRQAGRELGTWLVTEGMNNPTVILLAGSMGAGKTEFTKGIAEGMGVSGAVLSPTYTLAREYPFLCKSVESLLVHADLWRMDSEEELKDIRLSALREKRGVAVIEWSEKFLEALSKQIKDLQPLIVQVHISYADAPDKRIISMVHA